MDVAKRPSQFAWWAVIVGWMLAWPAVWMWTVRYEFTTDPPAAAFSQRHWPQQTSLELDPSRPTLVLFLHPKCPCTRASLRELERILTGTGLKPEQQPRVLVVASRPADAADDWHDTDILQKAIKLPYSRLILDRRRPRDQPVRSGQQRHGDVVRSRRRTAVCRRRDVFPRPRRR